MHLTPVKAIRKKCLDCCCDSANEVRACPVTTCPLYMYRLGKNPNRKRHTCPESTVSTNDSDGESLLTGNDTPNRLCSLDRSTVPEK